MLSGITRVKTKQSQDGYFPGQCSRFCTDMVPFKLSNVFFAEVIWTSFTQHLQGLPERSDVWFNCDSLLFICLSVIWYRIPSLPVFHMGLNILTRSR